MKVKDPLSVSKKQIVLDRYFSKDVDFSEPVIKKELDPNGLIWVHRKETGSERIVCFFWARNKKWTLKWRMLWARDDLFIWEDEDNIQEK